MNCKKISIIVPVYNVEEYLKDCIDSLIFQTYKNLEIIIVNDGSTDGSFNIIEDYSNRDDRIIFINQVNKGLSAARNVGLEIATGDFILFVDSDDYIENDVCLELVNYVNKFNVDLVIFGLKYLFNVNIIKKRLHIFKDIISGSKYFHESMVYGCYTPTVCNKFISIKLARKVKFPIGLQHEDIFYSTLILLKSNYVGCVDNVNYIYRKNRVGSITSELIISRVYDIFNIYKMIYNELEILYGNELNGNYFLLNIVERINMEVLIKLVDGTKTNDWWGIYRRVREDRWFCGLAKNYILRGQIFNHRVLLILFFLHPSLFRGMSRFYFVLRRASMFNSEMKKG